MGEYVNKNLNTNKRLSELYNKTKDAITIMNIDISKICFAKYQRPCNQKRVDKIVKEFTEYRFDPIKISHRSGMYWCVDGQHRVNAFKKLGKNTIQAQVMRGLSYEDEAFLFAEQQRNVVAVNKRAEWNARVEAGDVDAETTDIVNILSMYGYRLDIGSTGRDFTKMSKENKFVGCAREVQSIYRDGGANGLSAIMAIIDGAWEGTPHSTTASIMGGLHRVLATQNVGEYEIKRLKSQLTAVSPKELLELAKKEYGNAGSKGVGRAIVSVYNRKLSGNNKHRMEMYKI